MPCLGRWGGGAEEKRLRRRGGKGGGRWRRSRLWRRRMKGRI